jgi:thiol:disulfide interchange protein
MNRLWYSVMLVCVIVFTMTASAIERKRHASVTMNPTSLSVKAGEKASAKFILKLDKHWHTYPQREQLNADGIGPSTTLFSIEPKNIVQFDGTIKDPKGKKHYDAGFEMETESYEGMVTFEIPLRVKPTTKPGTYQIKIVSSMQLCDTASCIPPDDYIGTVALTVLDNPDAANTATTADTQAVAAISESPMTEKEKSTTKTMPQQATESTNEQPADTSWATLLLSAFGLGVLSWVMPCVYPMIPITVSFFTKRAEKEHTKPVIDSIVYALGIMATFVIFGVVVAIFFGASAGRDIASNPWLNLFLAALFLVISFNLFGAYEIQLPSSWINSLNKKSNEKSGYGASAIMGMVFSMTSFTCTVPFVNTTSMMAAGGEWFKPIIAMIVYSAVFALPFFLLALVPTLLTKLPRAGGWMNNIKVVFGFVEIAFAVSYFARTDSVLDGGLFPVKQYWQYGQDAVFSSRSIYLVSID